MLIRTHMTKSKFYLSVCKWRREPEMLHHAPVLNIVDCVAIFRNHPRKDTHGLFLKIEFLSIDGQIVFGK